LLPKTLNPSYSFNYLGDQKMEHVDLLIRNAAELVTLEGPKRPRRKNEMRELSIKKNSSIAVDDAKIVAVGNDLPYTANQEIDATGKTVMPGFIDPHTHLVFGGSREFELDQKLQGLSYMEILKQGGGIFYTVDKTRNATNDELKISAKNRLDTMLTYGTTTCEAKTGYGLNTETEIRLLNLQRNLSKDHPMDIVSTFLGAHAIPPDMTSDQYTDIIIDEMIPKTMNLATYCDVFCEKDVFTPEQSEKILRAGIDNGLIPKIHAEEIVNTGGASLAAKIGAISADHLLMISQQGIKDMANKGVIGVLLPGTPFSLMMDAYAPAQKLLNGNVPVALATDLNPNCWTENMQFMVQLACLKMKMTPAEAITAATYNAACALDLHNQVGSIEPQKQADILILNIENHKMLPYHFGVNLVESVIKKGQLITRR
jgi:imidazolonepropionase